MIQTLKRERETIGSSIILLLYTSEEAQWHL